MQERIRIIQPTDWSFEPMDNYIKNGGDAFSVSRFGYELFPNKGVQVDWVVPDYGKWYAKILRKFLKLEGCNLVLQLQLIKRSKNYDVVYYSADRHPYLLAIARKLRICKKPVLMVCHFSYDTRTVDSKIKKIILAMERKLVFSSMDQIVFNCETLMKLAAEDGKIPEKHMVNSGWGADIQYFQRGLYGAHNDIKPFYFAAGGANRDYHTLIEAFRKLPYKLVISCPRTVVDKESPLPNNIIFFDYSKFGMDSYNKLREFYHDCKAVLIPIAYRNHVANGASVFVEALACGKPIVVSDLNTNFLDVEKEGIGIKAKMHDADSWIKIIRYVEDHSEELEKMSKKAFEIAQNRYNYELFTDAVVQQMDKMSRQNKR
ncbi:MAG: glycosyltransferase family 4 protein [Lachnospiraceae bacterium]|nr:glycosyltransferase family 4 protein [Lachnospiraceae bacterium]